jgi:hypothetical protein
MEDFQDEVGGHMLGEGVGEHMSGRYPANLVAEFLQSFSDV